MTRKTKAIATAEKTTECKVYMDPEFKKKLNTYRGQKLMNNTRMLSYEDAIKETSLLGLEQTLKSA